MKPHQERAVQEFDDLTDKLCNLTAFIGSEPFYGLDEAEQSRLKRQHAAMAEYSFVLRERIEAFGEIVK